MIAHRAWTAIARPHEVARRLPAEPSKVLVAERHRISLDWIIFGDLKGLPRTDKHVSDHRQTESASTVPRHEAPVAIDEKTRPAAAGHARQTAAAVVIHNPGGDASCFSAAGVQVQYRDHQGASHAQQEGGGSKCRC